MFYSTQILARKGPLGIVWLAAHMDKGLKRSQVTEASIPCTVDVLLSPEAPLALRLSGQLLLGVVRIYARKVAYLLQDCEEALVKIKLAYKPGSAAAAAVAEQLQAAAAAGMGVGGTLPLDAITLPLPDTLEAELQLLTRGGALEFIPLQGLSQPMDALLGDAEMESYGRRYSLAGPGGLGGSRGGSAVPSRSASMQVHSLGYLMTSSSGGLLGANGDEEDEVFDDADGEFPFDLEEVEIERLRAAPVADAAAQQANMLSALGLGGMPGDGAPSGPSGPYSKGGGFGGLASQHASVANSPNPSASISAGGAALSGRASIHRNAIGATPSGGLHSVGPLVGGRGPVSAAGGAAAGGAVGGAVGGAGGMGLGDVLPDLGGPDAMELDFDLSGPSGSAGVPGGGANDAEGSADAGAGGGGAAAGSSEGMERGLASVHKPNSTHAGPSSAREDGVGDDAGAAAAASPARRTTRSQQQQEEEEEAPVQALRLEDVSAAELAAAAAAIAAPEAYELPLDLDDEEDQHMAEAEPLQAGTSPAAAVAAGDGAGPSAEQASDVPQQLQGEGEQQQQQHPPQQAAGEEGAAAGQGEEPMVGAGRVRPKRVRQKRAPQAKAVAVDRNERGTASTTLPAAELRRLMSDPACLMTTRGLPMGLARTGAAAPSPAACLLPPLPPAAGARAPKRARLAAAAAAADAGAHLPLHEALHGHAALGGPMLEGCTNAGLGRHTGFGLGMGMGLSGGMPGMRGFGVAAPLASLLAAAGGAMPVLHALATRGSGAAGAAGDVAGAMGDAAGAAAAAPTPRPVRASPFTQGPGSQLRGSEQRERGIDHDGDDDGGADAFGTQSFGYPSDGGASHGRGTGMGLPGPSPARSGGQARSGVHEATQAGDGQAGPSGYHPQQALRGLSPSRSQQSAGGDDDAYADKENDGLLGNALAGPGPGSAAKPGAKGAFAPASVLKVQGQQLQPQLRAPGSVQGRVPLGAATPAAGRSALGLGPNGLSGAAMFEYDNGQLDHYNDDEYGNEQQHQQQQDEGQDVEDAMGGAGAAPTCMPSRTPLHQLQAADRRHSQQGLGLGSMMRPLHRGSSMGLPGSSGSGLQFEYAGVGSAGGGASASGSGEDQGEGEEDGLLLPGQPRRLTLSGAAGVDGGNDTPGAVGRKGGLGSSQVTQRTMHTLTRLAATSACAVAMHAASGGSQASAPGLAATQLLLQPLTQLVPPAHMQSQQAAAALSHAAVAVQQQQVPEVAGHCRGSAWSADAAPISLVSITQGASRLAAARQFYDALVLQSRGLLALAQEAPAATEPGKQQGQQAGPGIIPDILLQVTGAGVQVAASQGM